MRKAGFVKSIKGAQGGYALTEEPSEISVGSILRALEGELAVVDKRDSGRKSLIQLCLNEFVWERMNDCLNEVVDSITLEDLACDYRRINGLDAMCITFSIS